MEIRPFLEADEAAVVALWNTAFPPTAPHHDPRLSIRNKLAVERELFFVAIVEGRLAGTIMAGYDGHRGWLYSLAVDPALRRRGIGSALMRRAEAALATLDCPKINLQVLPSNSVVVGMYQKLGFRVEERISMGKVLMSSPSTAG